MSVSVAITELVRRKALADVALGANAEPPGRSSVAMVKGAPTFPDPSDLARSRDARDRSWRESAARGSGDQETDALIIVR